MKKIILFVLILMFLGYGCATHKTADYLNSQIGRMTYEESLQQQGPPTRCAEEGRTKTCLWVRDSGGTRYEPMFTPGRIIPGFMGPELTPGEVYYYPIKTGPITVRITFIDGVLSSWRLTGNWE